jgi:YegS/Rv2252/BmrU family lipid kinase
MRKTLAIVNPVAGNRAAARAWHRLRLEAFECAMTERPGHARELAAAAPAQGYERVIAVGGDGTVCEVANGLARSDTPLGIVPVGTGNDIAHNLGIPTNPAAALELALSGAARSIDLGEIRTSESTTYFVCVAGFGFDAEVAWRVNRLPKVIGGTVPYVAGVLQTLWQYSAPRMRISIDGEVVDRATFLVAVANCASYGGGMRIAPAARPDDGVLDVCLVKDVSRLEVLRLVPKLYSGGHVGHPAVEMFRCRAVTADADRRVLSHADGELVGGLPAQLGILPGALLCVTGPVPDSSSR